MIKRRFDRTTEVMTTWSEDGHGDIFNVTQAHLRDYHARWFVMTHLYHKSRWFDMVGVETWRACWKAADGFGDTPPANYDWSHIRDSSWPAFRAMADIIARQIWGYVRGYATIYAAHQERLAQLDRAGIGPAEYYENAS